MASIEEPSNWTTATMDYILHEGDKLYQMIDTEQQLLLPSDLPTCITVFNKVCHIITGKEAFGSFVRHYKYKNCAVYIMYTTSEDNYIGTNVSR